MARRRSSPLLLLLGLAACDDAAAPAAGPAQPAALGSEIGAPTDGAQLHFLGQGSGTPPLETYQVSFWAVKGQAATVSVEYQPAPGQAAGTPFLQFGIAKDGLAAWPDGTPMHLGDSVQVTLNIDSTTMSVDFQPAGLRFSEFRPAMLQLWFHHADPDLNGDGVVDGADYLLCQQLDFWYSPMSGSPWVRLSSERDLTGMWVKTALHHFSRYAVSW